MAADTAFIARMRAALAAQADPSQAAPMQAYMKSAQPFLGIAAAVVQVQPLADVQTMAALLQRWPADIKPVLRRGHAATTCGCAAPPFCASGD